MATEVRMINWARVDELEADIGTEAFDEVVELFLEEVEEVTNCLERGDAGRDMAADMHFLKGSALNLGFDRLARLCAEGEALAAAGQAGRVSVADILSVYQASKSEFLGRGKAA